ncbi:hypothetical protein GCM10010501_03080 [Streptomyces libani subsp. rufus]|nr:hypothetical protein GCM10010501_03080 [Streptomyces libani subsp. rufus]
MCRCGGKQRKGEGSGGKGTDGWKKERTRLPAEEEPPRPDPDRAQARSRRLDATDTRAVGRRRRWNVTRAGAFD